jgi:hypothetical protein
MRGDRTDDLRGQAAQTSVCAVLIWVSHKQKTQTKGASASVVLACALLSEMHRD